MTNVIELPAAPRMSAAEFKVAREVLGLPARWVATQAYVAERSISRYESGAMPVGREAEAVIEAVRVYTNRVLMTSLRKLKVPKGSGFATLFTFRRDEDMKDVFVNEDIGPLPASWHRAMIGRLALLTDLPTKIAYITD